MSLCECGCGGEASPGKRFINGHNSRVNHPMKNGLSEEGKERKILNKLLKEGKIELPFCECGCGGRVTKLGNKYIRGHYAKVNPPLKGKTKETDERVKKRGEKLSKIKKAFFATDEGQQWLDENRRGENSPCFGKESWKKGLTKETDESVNRGAEKLSKTNKIFFQSEEGIIARQKLSKKKKEFFQTKEGQKWLDEHNRGENCSAYGKPSWNTGKTKETEEGLMRISEFMKGDKNPCKRPEVRKKMSIAAIRNLKSGIYNKKPTDIELLFQEICRKYNLPFRYVGNRQFWIGRQNPDFIECNGRKIVIELLGDWWHSALLNRRVQDDDLKKREQYYKRHGWKTIFIWGSDIKRPEGEKFVLSLLKKEGINI